MIKRMLLALMLLLCLVGQRALAADSNTTSQGVHATAGEASHNAGHEKPPLLPDPAKRETQLHALWVLIIFIVLLAVLYPTAWKNVLAGLKSREEKIRRDIDEAEAASARAQATLKEYNTRLATAENQVRDMIAKAVADGEKAAAGIRVQATAEAEEARQRATREIESARKQALVEIYASAAEISTSIAEKILRKNINPDDQRRLVQESLNQFQTVER